MNLNKLLYSNLACSLSLSLVEKTLLGIEIASTDIYIYVYVYIRVRACVSRMRMTLLSLSCYHAISFYFLVQLCFTRSVCPLHSFFPVHAKSRALTSGFSKRQDDAWLSIASNLAS